MAIDLHTHTSASDGSFTPVQLVRTAESIGLEALGITDHDTFAGWDEAVRLPRAASLELVCGIELSTKFRFDGARKGTSVHVLAYFLHGAAPAAFREWLAEAQRFRRDRNARLAVRLQSLGLNVTLDDAESLGGALTGRPHFAKVLIQKGHAKTMQEAFTRYLGEKGKAYVEREEPSIEGALGRITGAGGVPSLAHPVRVEEHAPDGFERLLADWKDAGLRAIEAWHSDHTDAHIAKYRAMAGRLGLGVTGGTDFHGDAKPGVSLGSGRGRLNIPRSVLDDLKG
ncbi:MAG TPA: PHP domain-containing protein [Bryobacteraceae bacterium]|nr:PHP domain-containing protein [Bryobacteraceae bacterium]